MTQVDNVNFLDYLKVKPASYAKSFHTVYETITSLRDYHKHHLTWNLSKGKTVKISIKAPSESDLIYNKNAEYKLLECSFYEKKFYGMFKVHTNTIDGSALTKELYNEIFSLSMKYISGKRLDKDTINQYI